MDSLMDTVDLSATLELRPNTGHSYGRDLNKRAGRSFGSVATRKRSAGESSTSGSFRSSTAASRYQSRFNRTSPGGVREPPNTSHQPQPPGSSPAPSPAPVLPPEQAWAAEEEETAWAQEQLSDKDRRRYEHEQSQMELMQFIEQLRTVGRVPR